MVRLAEQVPLAGAGILRYSGPIVNLECYQAIHLRTLLPQDEIAESDVLESAVRLPSTYALLCSKKRWSTFVLLKQYFGDAGSLSTRIDWHLLKYTQQHLPEPLWMPPINVEDLELDSDSALQIANHLRA